MTKRENGLKRRVLLIFAITVTGHLLMGWSGANGPPARVVSDPHSAFQSRMLEVGEELEYKVSYSFFTIGTIRTQVLSRETRNGRIVYKTRALIESNPSLSWLVDLHIRFYSEMDGSIYSYYWLSDD